MNEIDRCVQTIPPIKAPVPMPKLNIPEKIDIATEVCDCGVAVMISDCIATLNAVADIPIIVQTAIVTGTLNAEGSRSTTPPINPSSVTLMNLNLYLGKYFENNILPMIPAQPKSIKVSVIWFSVIFPTCWRNGSM